MITRLFRQSAIKTKQLFIMLDQLPAEGFEPTHSCEYWILSPARLPVPPRRLVLATVSHRMRARASEIASELISVRS